MCWFRSNYIYYNEEIIKEEHIMKAVKTLWDLFWCKTLCDLAFKIFGG
nr:MAG TPA: hypothetical protein [Caudoviricetes sp.]